MRRVWIHGADPVIGEGLAHCVGGVGEDAPLEAQVALQGALYRHGALAHVLHVVAGRVAPVGAHVAERLPELGHALLGCGGRYVNKFTFTI